MITIISQDSVRRINPTADFFATQETKFVNGKKVVLTTEDKINHIASILSNNVKSVSYLSDEGQVYEKNFDLHPKDESSASKYMCCFSNKPVGREELKSLKRDLKNQHKNDTLETLVKGTY